MLFAVDQEDVSEPAHRGEGRSGATERGDRSVFEEEVVERDGKLAIDGGPIVRVGGLHDDRPVHSHLLAVVLAKMGVVPVEAGIGERDPIGERLSDLDRRLGVDGHAVVAVVEPQPVPVNGRRDVAVVGHVDEDLGALVDMQRRPWDRAVVGDHPHGRSGNVFHDGRDLQGESVAVA